jgi:hypothetical protein
LQSNLSLVEGLLHCGHSGVGKGGCPLGPVRRTARTLAANGVAAKTGLDGHCLVRHDLGIREERLGNASEGLLQRRFFRCSDARFGGFVVEGNLRGRWWSID